MSMKGKIYSAVAVLALVAIVITVVSILGINSINSNVQALGRQAKRAVNIATIDSITLTREIGALNAILAATPEAREKALHAFTDVEANMSIKITPFVSEDQHITLDIEIEQTEFTDQAANEAPPGTATRSFKSLIRVQNEEMVLLGGIERNSTNKSSGGIPFVARIPVLKWIFGSATDNKTDNKLSIFIKPTIIE